MKILYFSTSWCSPCKHVRRHCIPELLRELPGAEIKEIDAMAEASLARKMKISAVPTTIIMREGKELTRRVGAFNAAMFAREVRPRIKSKRPKKADTES